MSGAGGGFAGMNDGSYFKAPGWVDLSLRPGESKQVPPSWGTWAKGVAKCSHVLFSPNTVWLAFALVDWFVFPWDLDAAKTWSAGWVLWRLAVNLLLTFGYTGFWHVALYVLRWSQRKFSPGSMPGGARVAHNVWYSFLGVLQWTAWEAIFMHIYATDRLPHIRDSEAFATAGNIARMFFWTAAIPIFRGCHFYFAHRFIHLKVIYKFVHSLHHRNVDIEPFAGLCMHPIEHLYYFSCIAPSLWFYMHPFHLVWNGMHLLLSPAASHSGWEDHMQSDQFHYLHHKKFECNYGSASFPLDHLFGTFRETAYGQSSTYRGGGADADAEQSKPVSDSQLKSTAAKQSQREQVVKYPAMGRAPKGFYVYMCFTCCLFLLAFCAIWSHTTQQSLLPAAEWLAQRPHLLAGSVAFGPIVFAALLMRLVGDRSEMSWPFNKDPAPKLSLHLVGGFVLGVLPVYQTLMTLLAPPDQRIYCQLWGCPSGDLIGAIE